MRVPAASEPASGSVSDQQPDPFARCQLRNVAAALLVAAHLKYMIAAQRSVRGHDDAHRAIHARQFLDDDAVLDVAQPRAAQILGEDGAHVAQLAQLADHFHGEDLVFVPFHDVRRDFRFGEFAHGFAQLDLFGGVFEIHGVGAGRARRSPLWRRPSVRCAAATIAFHRHAAGDGDAEAQLERAVRLLSRADGIQEILHVRVGRGARGSQHFRAIRAVHLLRQIADLLALGNGAVGRPARLRVLPSWLLPKPESHENRISSLCSSVTFMVSGTSRPSFHRYTPPAMLAVCGILQPHHLVPEGQLVAHVFVHVAARIIPEEAPVDIAVGVEIARAALRPGRISR